MTALLLMDTIRCSRSSFFGSFFCLLSLLAWVPAPAQSPDAEDFKVVAAVGKTVITRHDLKFYLLEVRLQQPDFWALPDEVMEEDMLTEAVHNQLLYEEFWKPGVEAPEPSIKEAAEDAWERLEHLAGSEVKLKAAIKRSGLTEQGVREWLEQQAGRRWIIEGEVNARLDPALFNQQDVTPGQAEEVHLASIFIKTIDTTSAESWESARERALFIRSQIEKGLVFEQAALLYSDDEALGIVGGDLGWVNPAHLEEEVRAGIDKLEAGGITEVQRGRGGWYLFKLIDFDTERRRKIRKLQREKKLEVLKRQREEADILLSIGYELRPLD